LVGFFCLKKQPIGRQIRIEKRFGCSVGENQKEAKAAYAVNIGFIRKEPVNIDAPESLKTNFELAHLSVKNSGPGVAILKE